MSDYSRFLALLANGGRWDNVWLLSGDTVKKMTSNQLTGGQLPLRFDDSWTWHGMGYGLGVGVQVDHAPDAGWPAGTFGWMGSSGVWAWTFAKESVSIIAMPQAMVYWEPGDIFQRLVYEEVSR
ncbi:MAG TPA: hypothetical protein VLE70_06915 [Anaerolineae bacterium]|jgi:CubicO group peptidase (beta-lactamase class C family)|nr:hypothetical protein [Anaerolineae bacterium]